MQIRIEGGRWRPGPGAGRRAHRPRRSAIGSGRPEQLETRALLTSAAFAVTSDWGTGFGGQITITNTQTVAVSNWTLSFQWDRSISSIWDATVASHSGNTYTIDNAGWNATIPAGGSVSFGFNGSSGNVGSDFPTNYALDGLAISSTPAPTPTPTPIPTPTPTPVPTPTPTPTPSPTDASVSFAVTSDWGTGFGGQITVVNDGSAPISNWTLGFTWDRSIGSIWNATSTQSGNQYAINNDGWNGTIPAGGSVSFGFNGSPGNVGTDVPSNYVLNGTPLGPAVPQINLSHVSVNAGAAGAQAVFTATLSQAAAQPVTVGYATVDGTAHAGTDYTASSGTLTFPAGATSETFAVSILPETSVKPNLTFQVDLSAPSGAALGTSSAIATIVDTITAPPTANEITTVATGNVAQSIDVLASTTDPSGYPLSVSGFTQPAHGTVAAGTGGSLVYTPAAGYLGADAFTYTVGDGHGGSATATVALTVVSPFQANSWGHFFAPYVDMTLYPTYNLSTAMQSAGLKDFTLAFITADANNAPAWGGYSAYEVNGGTFDQAIQAQVAQVRAAGGHVSVSFGGEAGTELAQAITNVGALTAAYQQVINAYGLTHIDFDIEGAAAADPASIDRRSQAIAALQASAAAAGKTLDVSFTLPVLPSGLTANGLYVLQSALKYGVKISTVNVMAMDYGDSAAPNPQGQMGTYAIDAATSLHTQLATLYGSTRTSSELWGTIGVTPMIGVNDASDEVFGLSDASQLLAFAESVGLAEISMWSLGRDQQAPGGALTYAVDNASSIVQAPFAFSDIFEAYTGSV